MWTDGVLHSHVQVFDPIIGKNTVKYVSRNVSKMYKNVRQIHIQTKFTNIAVNQ